MQELTNSELAAQLRALADIYEANPEIAQPYDMSSGSDFLFCRSKESFAATVKAFGCGEKRDAEDRVEFAPKSFPHLIISAYKGSVCERVVVGERVIPERIIPSQVIPQHTEEIVEYRCRPFLKTEEAA